MNNCQPGILAPVPKLARYLSFSLKAGSKPGRALAALVELTDGESVVVGLGQSLVRVLGGDCRVAGFSDAIWLRADFAVIVVGAVVLIARR